MDNNHTSLKRLYKVDVQNLREDFNELNDYINEKNNILIYIENYLEKGRNINNHIRREVTKLKKLIKMIHVATSTFETKVEEINQNAKEKMIRQEQSINALTIVPNQQVKPVQLEQPDQFNAPPIVEQIVNGITILETKKADETVQNQNSELPKAVEFFEKRKEESSGIGGGGDGNEKPHLGSGHAEEITGGTTTKSTFNAPTIVPTNAPTIVPTNAPKDSITLKSLEKQQELEKGKALLEKILASTQSNDSVEEEKQFKYIRDQWQQEEQKEQDVIKQLTLPLPLNSEYLEKNEQEKKDIAIEQAKKDIAIEQTVEQIKMRGRKKRTFDEVINLEKNEQEKKDIAIQQIKKRGFGFFNDISKEDKEREWKKRTFEVIKNDLQDFSPSIQELVKDAFLNN